MLIALLIAVLALQFVSAPVSISPNKNSVNADSMNGVSVSYTPADNGKGSDYTRSETVIEESSSLYATPAPNDEITVIVSVDGTPMMDFAAANGVSVAQALKTSGGKANFENLSRIRKQAYNSISKYVTEYRYEYSTVLNAFSATIRYADLKKIESGLYVNNVIISNTYAAPEAVTENYVEVYETGIFDSSDVGYDGTGTVVAVLDTGTDITHEVFDMELDPATIAITKDDVAAVATSLTATSLSKDAGEDISEDDLYVKTKLPYVYDYADSDTNVYPKESHGTHVAGVIAGKSNTITGVAPKAQIATFKVFSDYVSGAKTEWILAGLNDAVTLGVDAINMSLGTSCGFSREVDELEINAVYDKINEAGICLVVAASNDASSASGSTWGNTNLASNPDSGTVGSPGSYDASLSVASVSGVKTKYFTVDGKEIYFAESRLVGKTDSNDFVGGLLGDKSEGEFDYVVIPGVGLDVNYTGLDVNGKVVFIKRGNTNFEEKVRVAHEHGAIAAVVYNNVSGTISMSVGTKEVMPSCFITMDMAKDIVDAGSGTIRLSTEYLAGPFMSDFSSWGCLPNLTLAPDITAHGGEIYSSVAGTNQYDKMSGTSMATPNLAGALILVRQAVKESGRYVSTDADYTKNVRDESYSRMMSAATIVRNEEGNPYSPRKQGSGLADIKNSINTRAYLTVDGSNKPKLSLGDDPNRTGEYTLNFNIVNTSGSAVSYNIEPIVMTESMSSDDRTVAEKAYMFNDTTSTYAIKATKGKATINGNSIAVSGYGEAAITVTIKLSDADKQYLNNTFINGMFVEGFVQLVTGTLDGISLSIPFMAFYGNWADAPMLDVSAYQVGESAVDDSVLAEDKLVADVYGTLPYSGFYSASSSSEEKIGYWGMGNFAYIPAAGYEAPPAQEKYAAVTTNPDGDFLFYMVSAGLLRGAKRVDMEIRNSATGELLWTGVDYNARKSHGSGGQQTGGAVMVELNITKLDLPNNSKYTFTMYTYLDWQDENGEYTNGNRNKFSFEFTVDNERPELTDVAVRKTGNPGSERYLLELTMYDNHYIQGFSISTYAGSHENETYGYTEYDDMINLAGGVIPVASEYNRDSTFTLDVTSYWSVIQANEGKLYLSIFDYAKNEQSYDLVVLDKYIKDDVRIEKTRTASDSYSILPHAQIDLGEYIIERSNTNSSATTDDEKVFVEGYWHEDLVWKSSDSTVAYVDEKTGVVTGLKEGKATITVSSPMGKYDDGKLVYGGEKDIDYFLSFEITVAGTPLDSISPYQVEMSATGIALERGESKVIYATVKPAELLEKQPVLEWMSTSSSVSVVPSADGYSATVTALNSGSATVRATVKGTNVAGYTSVRVLQEYTMYENIYLRSYTGRGGDYTNEDGEVEHNVVDIPEDQGVVYIYPRAFMRNEYIKKVIIPEGVTTIMELAFYNCESLEEIVLPSSLETIEQLAFADCNNLKKITGLGNVKSIGDSAFWGAAVTEIDLSSCTYVDNYAFAFCQSLESVDLSRVGIVGGGAFSYCTSLKSLVIPAHTSMAYDTTYLETDRVLSRRNQGGAFAYCTELESVEIYADSVGKSAFYACEKLRSVTFYNDVNVIGEQAFKRCVALTNINFSGSVYRFDDEAFAECSSLTSFTLPDGLTVMGSYVFSGDSFTTMTISSGANLTNIQAGTFNGLTRYVEPNQAQVVTNNPVRISRFDVENGNKYLSSDNNGILYDRAGKKIIAFPSYAVLLRHELIINENVTTIGAGAFSNSYDITTIDLSNVEYIEEGAFENSSITTISGADNVKYIGERAFKGSKITSLPISAENTTYIGDYAFADVFGDVTGTLEFTAPKNLEYLGSYAFDNSKFTSVSFKDSSIKSVGNYAFNNSARLNKIELGSLESVSRGMFNNCSMLKTVDFGKVKEIGAEAFKGCSKLESIELPEKLTEIADGTFENSGLTTIELPDSLTVIGANAFAGSALGTINLSNVTEIGNAAFKSTKLVSVNAYKVKTVGNNAFENCTDLVSVNMPVLRSLGDSAFESCAVLDTVTLPEIRTVGKRAFAKCVALEGITLNTAETLGDQAFAEASALKTVSINGVKNIGYEILRGTVVETVSLPETLNKVTEGAFNGADNITAITVDDANKSFLDDNGVLYIKNDSNFYTLVAYPAGKTATEYSVLDRTIKLGAYSFGGNKSIRKLTLPVYLEVIGVSAMKGMDSLTEITIYAVEAPTLESKAVITYKEDSVEMESGYREVADENGYVNTYENFNFEFGSDAEEDRDLRIIVPANASGYDNKIWKAYVGKYITSSKLIHASSGTLDYIERIVNLPDAPTADDAEEVAALLRIYNMLDQTQMQFVTGNYNYTEGDNSIDKAYYLALFGSNGNPTNFYSILQAKAANATSATLNNSDIFGAEVNAASTSINGKLFAVIVLAVVAIAAVIVSLVQIKRRDR
ncbi:MAG: leucine-rich repeat protein [Clostridiales bacterium]|nr:leucine-rich repeat protein [Clostridiales bacterium]